MQRSKRVRYAARTTAFGAAVLALAGCASTPEVVLDPGSNPLEARSLLAAAAAEGPVLVTWRGDPPVSPPTMLRAVEQGATGLSFTATREGDAARRFVFDFTGTNTSLCGDPLEDRSTLSPYFVKAAFCDGDRAVSMAGSEPGGASERLIWRMTGRLVPDDYQQTYGLNVFGGNFGVGLGGTIGF